MNRKSTLMALGLGAGLMYLLDPERGNRRRALVSDKATSVMNTMPDASTKTLRDLSNRTYGLMAEMRSLMSRGELSDAQLEARVRERLGGTVSHPGAIEVSARANDGHVTLSGHVLAHEVDRLMSTVSSVRGVNEVENRLEVHEDADGVPALQGQPARPKLSRGKPEFLQENWAPSTRVSAGTIGSGLTLLGLRRRGVTGTLTGLLGLGLLARAVTNLPAKRLVGIGGGRRAVDVQKGITVNAPVEEVFRFWDNFENFPRFMSHLREVKVTDRANDRSHWVAEGPADVPIEWDAVVTKRVPNREIAWKSVEGSTVGTAGSVKFQEAPGGGTRIDVKLSYNPPAGAVGHAVATLFGKDPKTAMDEDLARLKSLIEEGKATAEGREVTREEVARQL